MQPASDERASEGEYLEREHASTIRHEYVNGRVHAMAGGSPRHNLITANTSTRLNERLRAAGKRCFVFSSDQRVFVPTTGLYTYPDVTIVCGRPQIHPMDRTSIVNPLVLVEVLSASTESFDRGAKFAHYRTIESLEGYVLVSQADRLVECYRRFEGRQWILSEYHGSEAAVIAALGVELPLDEIYENSDQLEGD